LPLYSFADILDKGEQHVNRVLVGAWAQAGQ
jgi:hypothetical protein